MLCSQCGGHWVDRDYAPPRSYALMLTGLLLLLPRAILAVEYWAPAALTQYGRLPWFGLLILAYGVADTFRHDLRYCRECGYRFRACRGRGFKAMQDDEPSRLAQAERKAELTRAQTASAPQESSASAAKVNPNQPIEPLLKCLRFKNEAMRADAARTLAQLTGHTFGTDAEAWERWWAENKSSYRTKPMSKGDSDA